MELVADRASDGAYEIHVRVAPGTAATAPESPSASEDPALAAKGWYAIPAALVVLVAGIWWMTQPQQRDEEASAPLPYESPPPAGAEEQGFRTYLVDPPQPQMQFGRVLLDEDAIGDREDTAAGFDPSEGDDDPAEALIAPASRWQPVAPEAPPVPSLPTLQAQIAPEVTARILQVPVVLDEAFEDDEGLDPGGSDDEIPLDEEDDEDLGL